MERTVTITAYRDGPFLVRGPVVLVGEDGEEIEIRRAVVPLCRCGRSRTKPLCDGVHEAMGLGARNGSADQPAAANCSRSTGE